MALIINHIRLRIETNDGQFGTDIPLTTGLNVLWADNTKGKSTAMQSVIYALGLEGMLSAKRAIPLPYVMNQYLKEGDGESQQTHTVLESSVWLELKNRKGDIITVRRYVISKGGIDRKLISVYSGPLITNPNEQYQRKDYFVLDAGAAQREAGFHYMLANFMGWVLPVVNRYDGGESTLYLETIFPLFFVEQKSGWSTIPAPFPTQYQIRDVGQRAVEFVLALETHELELRRQQLELDIALSKQTWTTRRERLFAIAALIDAKVEGVSPQPMIAKGDIELAQLTIPYENKWHPIQDVASSIRGKIASINEQINPTVDQAVSDAPDDIKDLTLLIGEQNTKRSSLFRALQTEISQKKSILIRLDALNEDLQKNNDAQKLRSFGSNLTDAFSADHCPTCAQSISDILLDQDVRNEVMSIEDNIEYIKAQRQIFKNLSLQSDQTISAIELELASITRDVNSTSARLRSVKADMIAPSNSPSIQVLEARIRLESYLEALTDAKERFELGKAALNKVSEEFVELVKAKEALPKDRLTINDKNRLIKLTNLFQQQANAYGFSTFATAELEISDQSYKPQKEGFDIGFEISASDAIRLKWSYLLALLELARSAPNNHVGFVVFDEPRQQEASKVSFKQLLKRASTSFDAGQQVLFATSEDIQSLKGFLSDIDHKFIQIDGWMVKRITD